MKNADFKIKKIKIKIKMLLFAQEVNYKMLI